MRPGCIRKAHLEVLVGKSVAVDAAGARRDKGANMRRNDESKQSAAGGPLSAGAVKVGEVSALRCSVTSESTD